MQQGLYEPRFEHDSCGVGFIVQTSAAPCHELLQMGLEALSRLAHRGAIAADGRSGDGAGITAGLPQALFQGALCEAEIHIGSDVPLAAGMIFVDPAELASSSELLEAALSGQNLELLCWREVPICRDALGATALEAMPVIRQALIAPHTAMSIDELERRLHRSRPQRCSFPGSPRVPPTTRPFYPRGADPRSAAAWPRDA